MVPHHHLKHHFREKATILPKLPFLHREDMSRRRGPSGFHLNSKEHPWQPQDSLHRKDDIFLEEQTKHVPSRRASGVDKVFPLKPVLHKRAYSLSNCQINPNVSNSDYQERFYSCLPRLTDQASVRQQQKFVRKPDALKPTHPQLTERKQTTRSDVDGEHQEQRFSERLSKEINSKEMILQQKICKAEETLRRIQRERTNRHDGVRRDEKNQRYLEKEKCENRLYNDGYDDWDDDRDTYENEKKTIRDDMERWEVWERKVNERVKEGRRQPLTSEMTHKSEWIQYENTVHGRRGEMLRETQRNSTTENHMGWDTWDRRESGNVEELNKVRKGKNDRRREMHGREDEEQRNMRNPGSSESERTHRSHLKQERFTNVKRRENHEGVYEPTSGLTGRRRTGAVVESVPDRNPSQRGNRLLQAEFSLEESPDASQQLVECGVCHRHFLRDRLETHMRVCEKKRPQRKIFDMSQHRAKGTELEKFMKTNSRSKTPELKKNNWRQKHEAFIQTMRQGRTHVPGSYQPQSLSNLNSEYKSCPHCGRKFAPGPAERHIPKCQNIRSRPPPPKPRAPQPTSAGRKTTR